MKLRKKASLWAASALVPLGLVMGAAQPAQAYTYTLSTSSNVACWWRYSSGVLTGQYSYIKWVIRYRSDNRRKIDTVFASAAPDGGSYVSYFNRMAAHQEVTVDGRWIGSGFDSNFSSRTSYTFGPTSDNAMGYYSNGSAMELHASLYNGANYCSILHSY